MNSPSVMAPPSSDARVIFCPECGRRYTLRASFFEDASLHVLCGACETPFRLSQARTQPARSEPSVQAAASRPTVVVAHESPAVCATVGRVLEEAGYTARYVHDGARAIAAFDASLPDRPVALVLDVGVPEVMAFQVSTILKGRTDPPPPKIILLASVFERTRYKRRPTTLHGADAYVELHHIPDRLGALLEQLLGARSLPEMRPHLPVERARAETLRSTPPEAADDETARTLARRLVSDVALYHEASIARGMTRGQPLGEPEVASALAEARAMFTSQLGDAAQARMSLFDDAVRDLLSGLAGGRDPGA